MTGEYEKTNTGEYRPDWLPRGSQRRKKQIVQDGAALSTPCAKRHNFSYTIHMYVRIRKLIQI